MAVKFSELSKKLKMTNLELRRAIKKLGIDVPPRAAMIRKEIAEKILDGLGYKKKEAKVKKPKKEKAKKGLKEGMIELPKVMTVREFASIMKISVSEVITSLLKNGLMITINENIDYETAAIIASDFGLEAVAEKEKEKELPEQYLDKKENLTPRSPVVVVMGHVDHGKTTLLDSIRKTKVVEGESGGITQHIGAYRVLVKSKDKKKGERYVTFLDTPGHEAFTMMRAHGGRLADIAILVVAADDGVRPQTIEAIDHIKASGVPAVVAINKIDMPGADPERVKKELSENGLPVEGWGGNTPSVAVSAKKGEHIDELLEVLLLVVDMNDLKGDPTGLARGLVIESRMHKGSGPLSSILIQKGTLSQGDILVAGDVWGKIKRMENELGEKMKEATPSMPVRILGLSGVARFGDLALEMKDEKGAKDIIKEREREKAAKTIGELGMAEAAKSIREGKAKSLKLIIKTDVAGSLKAIKDSVVGLSTKDVKVEVVGQGVGEVSVSDIELARASDAVIVAFKVGTNLSAKRQALQEKIKISSYEIIYELIDDIAAALEGLLEPEIIEEDTGKGRILKIFKHHRRDKIIGAKITSGYVSVGTLVRIKREGKLLGEAEIKNLQQAENKAEKVEAGNECGLNLVGEVEAKEGDRLEFYKKVEKVRKIKRS
ncbi:MAG: translation initiation factor IF-2 [Candidatus Berkelbacteria bacterium]|nr:translation initiation factor IF-2 [Candidatus Berkelbacteria bacterium]